MQFLSYNYVKDEPFQFVNLFSILGSNLETYAKYAPIIKEGHLIKCPNCDFFLTKYNSRFKDLESYEWQWQCDICEEMLKVKDDQQIFYKQTIEAYKQRQNLFSPINLGENYHIMVKKSQKNEIQIMTYIYIIDTSASTQIEYESEDLHERFGTLESSAYVEQLLNSRFSQETLLQLGNVGFSSFEIYDFYDQIKVQLDSEISVLEIAFALKKINENEYKQQFFALQNRLPQQALENHTIQSVKKENICKKVSRKGIIIEMLVRHLKTLKMKAQPSNVFFILFSDEIVFMPPKGKLFTESSFQSIQSTGLDFYLDNYERLRIQGDILNDFTALGKLLDKILNTIEEVNFLDWDVQDIKNQLLEVEASGQTALGPALYSGLKLAKKINSSSSQIVLITDGRANKGCGGLEDINQQISPDHKLDKIKKAMSFYENLGGLARLYGTTINVFSFSDSQSDLDILNAASNQNGGILGRIEIDEQPYNDKLSKHLQIPAKFTSKSFQQVVAQLCKIVQKDELKATDCTIKLHISTPYKLTSNLLERGTNNISYSYIKGNFNPEDTDIIEIDKCQSTKSIETILISSQIKYCSKDKEFIEIYHVVQKNIAETVEDMYDINYPLSVNLILQLWSQRDSLYLFAQFLNLIKAPKIHKDPKYKLLSLELKKMMDHPDFKKIEKQIKQSESSDRSDLKTFTKTMTITSLNNLLRNPTSQTENLY